MRLLLDECIDERLRRLFPSHDCQSARFAQLAGLKNGMLLDAAEARGFDVLITVDQGIPDHQNLAGRKTAVVIPPATAANTAISIIRVGEVVRIR